MVLIAPAELAAIQAETVKQACDKTCLIYRKTAPTKDGYGQAAPNYTLLYTTVAGVAEPTGTQLQNFDFMIGSLVAWQVKLPIGTDVMYQDHLEIDGQYLEVHVVLTPRSYAALLTCVCAEVK